jgi:hypothetical protein
MTPAGRHFFPRDLVRMNYQAGWTDARKLVIITAIELAEGNGYEQAKHINPDGSIDRGLFQINDRAHPDCPDSVAYDAVKATAYARKIYTNHGGSFGAWSAYTNKAYLGPRAMGYACPAVGNWLLTEFGVA